MLRHCDMKQPSETAACGGQPSSSEQLVTCMHRVHCKLWRHINPIACNACNYCWTVGHQTGYNRMLDPVLCVVRSFQERIFKDGAMEPCGKRLAKRCTRGDQNPKWLLRNRQWSVAAFPMQTCCLVPRRNARTGLQTAEEVGVWGVEVCRILLCGPPAISSSAVSSIHVSYFQSWEDNPWRLGLPVFGLKLPISFASVHDAPVLT